MDETGVSFPACIMTVIEHLVYLPINKMIGPQNNPYKPLLSLKDGRQPIMSQYFKHIVWLWRVLTRQVRVSVLIKLSHERVPLLYARAMSCATSYWLSVNH